MLTERFWTKVRRAGPDDCWEWQANKNNKGYGLFRPGGTQPKRLAHRLSYEELYGPLLPGSVVRHSCDNPACVNPAHLSAGTQKDNMLDCAIKERVGNTRLSSEQVIALRRSYIDGEARESIAARFGISVLSVSDYTDGKSWQHLLGVDGAPSQADLDAAKRRKPGAKIDAKIARDIKRRLAKGELGISIAARYGIHKATVSDIRQGKCWRDA